jgi:hypothetical protein
MSTPHLTPEENLARAATLDELARLDGRSEPGHPHRHILTGLGRPFTRLMALEGAFAHLEGLVGIVARLEARVEALEAAQAPQSQDVELSA